jgi:hypothetical protein
VWQLHKLQIQLLRRLQPMLLKASPLEMELVWQQPWAAQLAQPGLTLETPWLKELPILLEQTPGVRQGLARRS